MNITQKSTTPSRAIIFLATGLKYFIWCALSVSVSSILIYSLSTVHWPAINSSHVLTAVTIVAAVVIIVGLVATQYLSDLFSVHTHDSSDPQHLPEFNSDSSPHQHRGSAGSTQHVRQENNSGDSARTRIFSHFSPARYLPTHTAAHRKKNVITKNLVSTDDASPTRPAGTPSRSVAGDMHHVSSNASLSQFFRVLTHSIFSHRWISTAMIIMLMTAFTTVLLATPLAGTLLYLGGISIDQQFRTEFLTRSADSPALHDMTYAHLPSFYPSFWFWVGGRCAHILHMSGWEFFKPYSIVSLSLAATLAFLWWNKLASTHTSERLVVPQHTVWITVATILAVLPFAEEPYSAALAFLFPPMVYAGWLELTSTHHRLSPLILIGVFLGIAAASYTLYAAVFAWVIAFLVIGIIVIYRQTFVSRHLIKKTVIIYATAFLVALPWWFPFLSHAAFHSSALFASGGATAFLPLSGAQLYLPFFDASITGLICLLGVAWILIHFTRHMYATASGITILALYSWQLLSQSLTVLGTTLLSFRLNPLIATLLSIAGVIGTINYLHHVSVTTLSHYRQRSSSGFSSQSAGSTPGTTVITPTEIIGVQQSLEARQLGFEERNFGADERVLQDRITQHHTPAAAGDSPALTRYQSSELTPDTTSERSSVASSVKESTSPRVISPLRRARNLFTPVSCLRDCIPKKKPALLPLFVVAIIAIAWSQSLTNTMTDPIERAYTDTDGHGQRADRRPAGAEQYYPQIHELIQEKTHRAERDSIVMTSEYGFLALYPYSGYQSLTPHYANPLAHFADRNQEIITWSKAHTPVELSDALRVSNTRFATPTVWIFAVSPQGKYVLRMSEDVFPNSPNVHRFITEFDPAAFRDSHYTAHIVGPFAVIVDTRYSAE